MASKRIKIAAIGLGTMAMIGGGAAFAQSAVAAASGKPGPHPGVAGAHGHHLLHLEKTYTGKDGTTMTLVAVSGSVTAVSATSITVTASDGNATVFAVSDSTKVMRVDPTATPKHVDAAIGDVHTGDSVIVGARGPAGTDAPATRILVRP